MEHLVYITLVPNEGTEFDAGFNLRCSITDSVVKTVAGASDAGGGTNFEPLEYDVDFTVTSAREVLDVLQQVVNKLPVGWTVRRINVVEEAAV